MVAQCWKEAYLQGSPLPLHPWEAASGVGSEERYLVAVVWLLLEPSPPKLKTRKSPGVLFQSELQGRPLSALSPWKTKSNISQVLAPVHSTSSQLVLKSGMGRTERAPAFLRIAFLHSWEVGSAANIRQAVRSRLLSAARQWFISGSNGITDWWGWEAPYWTQGPTQRFRIGAMGRL